MSRRVKDSDIKLLYSLSAGRCNICYTAIFYPKLDETGHVNIGEMAHIVAYSNNLSAPRAIDSSIPDNSYSNLILLCANHHKEIDQDLRKYTSRGLLEIKRNFESSINKRINYNPSTNDVTVIELIKELCNLQYIHSQLLDSFSIFPIDISNIGDVESILEKIRPSMYPFQDEKLNAYIMSILAHYNNLRGYMTYYYYPINESMLAPIAGLEIIKEDRELINHNASLLSSAIYNWLLYCRSVYNL